jgi:hypothetical protein
LSSVAGIIPAQPDLNGAAMRLERAEEGLDMSNRPEQYWEDVEDQFRADWERSYPNTPWNDVSYGYRYGWERGRDERYADRDWDSIEGDLRSGWNDWQSRNRTGSVGQQIQQGWEDLKDSVRRGWDKAKREADKLI